MSAHSLYCKRGHLRSPENLSKCGACKLCRHIKRIPQHTHCRKGHLYTAESWNGIRCMTCKREIEVWTRLQMRYGVSKEQFYDMLHKQGSKCAICFTPFELSGLGKLETRRAQLYPRVDHAHTKGAAVRGLLCHPCNMVLGYAHDSRKVLLSAIDYLQKHSEHS